MTFAVFELYFDITWTWSCNFAFSVGWSVDVIFTRYVLDIPTQHFERLKRIDIGA